MKTILALMVAVMLTACGTSDPYAKRAEAERQRQERYVERTIDKAPDWMLKVPMSNSAVYANGTARSGDWSMAVYKAKADAYGKICMSAGGTVSQNTKIYKSDTENASGEMSEMAIRSSCKSVDITGVEVSDKKIIQEGNFYRVYVLVVLPTGDANILRKARESARAQEAAARRAPDAFKELN
jgi:hypothetical protein